MAKLTWLIWNPGYRRVVGRHTADYPPEDRPPGNQIYGIETPIPTDGRIIHGGLSSPYFEELTTDTPRAS